VGGQDDLGKSLKAIMATQRDELGGPPSPEELLAYRDGRLAEAERRRIEERIAVHPDAARALADLAAFPDVEPAPGTPELSDEEIGDRWQAFREKLPELPVPTPAIAIDARPARRGSPFTLRLAAAILMGLAIGGIAGFLGGRASRDQSSGAGSAINVRIAPELAPEGEGESRAAPSILEMPEGAEELVLVLRLPAQRDFSDYEAEIVDGQGVRVWEREGLRPTEMGTFQVSFRAGTLKPGPLRVRLYGREGKGRTLIATYEVRLVPGVGSR
jgi:hypothetical protein